MAKTVKTPVSFRLSQEEMELLDQAAALFDGNKTKAFVEALRALLRGGKARLTKADLLAELKRRLK